MLQAAEFSGRVTLDQEEDADIKRAGYCVANSQVQYVGDYFDLSGFSHLVYTVKGDGRTYIANVRTDSIVGTGGDLWQAPFKTRLVTKYIAVLALDLACLWNITVHQWNGLFMAALSEGRVVDCHTAPRLVEMYLVGKRWGFTIDVPVMPLVPAAPASGARSVFQ
jgi:hypothetical protein